MNADTQNIIDKGLGGYLDIPLVSPMKSFAAEQKNTTNGVETKYYFMWETTITTAATDIIYITLPNELTLAPTSGKYLACNGMSGITSLTCEANG